MFEGSAPRMIMKGGRRDVGRREWQDTQGKLSAGPAREAEWKRSKRFSRKSIASLLTEVYSYLDISRVTTLTIH